MIELEEKYEVRSKVVRYDAASSIGTVHPASERLQQKRAFPLKK